MTLSQQQLLTVRQVADWLQVPASWIYERTRKRGQNHIRHIRLGKHIRFTRGQVIDYLESQVRGPSAN